jgi:hypothetical protein
VTRAARRWTSISRRRVFLSGAATVTASSKWSMHRPGEAANRSALRASSRSSVAR